MFVIKTTWSRLSYNLDKSGVMIDGWLWLLDKTIELT